MCHILALWLDTENGGVSASCQWVGGGLALVVQMPSKLYGLMKLAVILLVYIFRAYMLARLSRKSDRFPKAGN